MGGSEQAPGVEDWQGSLESWSPWGHQELDTTEQLNWGKKYTFVWLFYSITQAYTHTHIIYYNIIYNRYDKNKIIIIFSVVFVILELNEFFFFSFFGNTRLPSGIHALCIERVES